MYISPEAAQFMARKAIFDGRDDLALEWSTWAETESEIVAGLGELYDGVSFQIDAPDPELEGLFDE